MIEVGDAIFITDIKEILKDLGLRYKESNNNYMICCPYHKNGKEKKPSCGINEDGIFHCFTCGQTGTISELISYVYGNDDMGVFGYQWLCENYGGVDIEKRKKIDLFSKEENKVKRAEVDATEVEYYMQYYNPYLENRGISIAIQDKFKVGFEPKLNNVVFTIFNANNNIIGFAKRNMKTKRYINEYFEKSEILYGLNFILSATEGVHEIWIVEGFIDCLTLWSRGKYAVALMGCIPTNKQIQILNNLDCRKFIRCLDNDDAGKKGNDILKEKLNALSYRYIYPNCKKDVNELTDEEFNQGNISLF